MSALERKVVHEHLKSRHDVETYSEGQEPARRLVVAPLVGLVVHHARACGWVGGGGSLRRASVGAPLRPAQAVCFTFFLTVKQMLR